MAPATLTEKQQQVYNLLTDDKDPKAIADALGVSKAAIYSHIRGIKEAGHAVPAKYANVGTGGGRGGSRKAAGSRRGRNSGKTPAAVVPPAPTPPAAPAPEPTADDLVEVDAIVSGLTTNLGGERARIQARVQAITEEVQTLQSRIESLGEEARNLTGADQMLSVLENRLAEGVVVEDASEDGSAAE